jgi:hypothetical protein
MPRGGSCHGAISSEADRNRIARMKPEHRSDTQRYKDPEDQGHLVVILPPTLARKGISLETLDTSTVSAWVGGTSAVLARPALTEGKTFASFVHSFTQLESVRVLQGDPTEERPLAHELQKRGSQ